MSTYLIYILILLMVYLVPSYYNSQALKSVGLRQTRTYQLFYWISLIIPNPFIFACHVVLYQTYAIDQGNVDFRLKALAWTVYTASLSAITLMSYLWVEYFRDLQFAVDYLELSSSTTEVTVKFHDGKTVSIEGQTTEHLESFFLLPDGGYWDEYWTEERLSGLVLPEPTVTTSFGETSTMSEEEVAQEAVSENLSETPEAKSEEDELAEILDPDSEADLILESSGFNPESTLYPEMILDTTPNDLPEEDLETISQVLAEEWVEKGKAEPFIIPPSLPVPEQEDLSEKIKSAIDHLRVTCSDLAHQTERECQLTAPHAGVPEEQCIRCNRSIARECWAILMDGFDWHRDPTRTCPESQFERRLSEIESKKTIYGEYMAPVSFLGSNGPLSDEERQLLYEQAMERSRQMVHLMPPETRRILKERAYRILTERDPEAM